jgi:class 3 adenylate cyclase
MRGCTACGESNPVHARFCLGCGLPLEAQTEAAAELRRTISIVFADLVGSTMLGEALDAEALRYVTGRYFDTMRTAVERHGGTVEKFIGDAVVALFGVPRVREDDAFRAVRAAADMQTSLTTLNDELRRDLAIALQMRIGINTGEVIVGERRAGGSPATGDAVNIAARLEQAAGPGEVLIGDSTYRLVRDEVTAEQVQPLPLKGKSSPVAAWRLASVAAPEKASTNRLPNRFVGRDLQLHLLEDAFRRVARERTCQLVTVLGVAGVGKSRLAEEFVAPLPKETVLEGRCLSYGHGATYWPLREAVLGAVGLTGDEPADVARRAFSAALGDSPDAPNVVVRLLALSGFNRESAVPEDMPWAVRVLLERLSQRHPLVLVVDDLHWAEPGLLDVLEHIADWSRDSPIMLLALARPEFYESRPAWGGGKLNATAVLLPTLDEAATVSLMAQHDLPAAVMRRIADAAGGNPLFAEQLVAMLVDQGYVALQDGAGTWVGGPPDEVEWTMPPSVSALLTARIDSLGRDERQVVGGAAVVGTLFYAEAVAAITGTPLAEVQQLLGQLVRKELMRAAATDLAGLTAGRFLHVLVRDAAYDGLPKATRAAWHERLADWLSSLGSDAVPDEIVGHHLASAWEYRTQLGPPTGEARQLAVRAGRKLAAAGRRLALSDAAASASLLQRAADLVEPDDPQRVEWLLSLADQRLELGEIEQARGALRLTRGVADPRQAMLAELLMARSSSLTADSRVEEGEEVARKAVRCFQQWDDDRGLAHAYLTQADLAGIRGQHAVSARLLESALKHAQLAGDAGCVARARSLLAITMLFGPTPAEEAIAVLTEMVISSGNDPRVRADAEQVTCVMHAMCGRFEQARSIGADARQHLADVGHGLFLANLAQSTGHVEELAGDLAAAEREYARSCTDLGALGESAYLSTVAGLHARVLARRGRPDQARAALTLARRHGSEDDVTTHSLVWQAEGLLAAAAGQPARARAAVADSLRLESGGEQPDAYAESCLTGADVEQLLGDGGAAREHLIAAQRLFQAKGNVVRADEVSRRLRGGHYGPALI